MKNKDILLKNLIEVGLSDNEAATYLALISFGNTSIARIAKNTGIKRTTIYHTLGFLIEKGLVRIEYVGLKKIYLAEEPVRLKDILDQRLRKFELLLPDLNALHINKGIDGSVKQYQGMKAIKQVYDQILNEVGRGEDYCVITDQEKWLKLDESFFHSFIERRAKLNLNIRIFYTRSVIAEKYKTFERNFNQQVKYLPEKTIIGINLIITKHKVIMHRLHEPYKLIVIDDPLIIEMHKEQFNIMWHSL